MPLPVTAPARSVPLSALSFGTLGADAQPVARTAGLPVESAEAGVTPAPFAAGTSLTAAIDLDRQRLHRVVVPAGWSAAALTFQSSYDGTTFSDLHDVTGEVTLPASAMQAGRAVVADPAVFFGVRWLKIRSGTAASPVAQAAAPTLMLATVAR